MKKIKTVQDQLNSGKVYVLRENQDYRQTISHPEYYTGKKPTHNIGKAKYFTEHGAGVAQKFAHTGFRYDIYPVPSKQLFLMILQGK